jgi:hypothetical protein
MTGPVRNIAVFDLSGVLIDWEPRHLYRKLFKVMSRRWSIFSRLFAEPNSRPSRNRLATGATMASTRGIAIGVGGLATAQLGHRSNSWHRSPQCPRSKVAVNNDR